MGYYQQTLVPKQKTQYGRFDERRFGNNSVRQHSAQEYGSGTVNAIVAYFD